MFHSRRLVLLIFASANFINCVQCIITFLPQTKTHVNIGDSTTLSCHVTPLTGVIRFVKDGTTVGQCTAPVPGLFPGTCTPSSIVQDIFTENTTWIIPSATFTSLNGSWECSHNTERDSSEIFVTDRATVLQTNEATIPANFDKNTQFQVFVNCSYPQPEITWKLKTCSGTSNIIDVIVNPTVVETSSTCISPRRIYSSSIKVSDMANPQERTCYKATATLSYSYTTSISISSSFSQDIFIDAILIIAVLLHQLFLAVYASLAVTELGICLNYLVKWYKGILKLVMTLHAEIKVTFQNVNVEWIKLEATDFSHETSTCDRFSEYVWLCNFKFKDDDLLDIPKEDVSCSKYLKIFRNKIDLKKVVWYYQGIKIDKRNAKKYEGGSKANPGLKIQNVEDSDAGKYQCILTFVDEIKVEVDLFFSERILQSEEFRVIYPMIAQWTDETNYFPQNEIVAVSEINSDNKWIIRFTFDDTDIDHEYSFPVLKICKQSKHLINVQSNHEGKLINAGDATCLGLKTEHVTPADAGKYQFVLTFVDGTQVDVQMKVTIIVPTLKNWKVYYAILIQFVAAILSLAICLILRFKGIPEFNNEVGLIVGVWIAILLADGLGMLLYLTLLMYSPSCTSYSKWVCIALLVPIVHLLILPFLLAKLNRKHNVQKVEDRFKTERTSEDPASEIWSDLDLKLQKTPSKRLKPLEINAAKKKRGNIPAV